jgi:hypothetical protein
MWLMFCIQLVEGLAQQIGEVNENVEHEPKAGR